MGFFSENKDKLATLLQTTSPPAAADMSGPRPLTWQHLLIPLLFIGVRMIFASITELHPDEAYYWVWSRSPAAGYFDHPPLVAYLIRASTGLFGASELAVRLPAILLTGGTIMLASLLAALLGAAARTILWLQAALFAFPLVHGQAAVIAPDTPANFFVMASLVAAALWHKSPSREIWWITLGIACGMAMLSKYTAVIPCTALIAMLVIASPTLRLRAILAGALAAVVIAPMLIWNYQHDWLSFRFQLGHGFDADKRSVLRNVGEYLASLLLVGTPILSPLLIHRTLVSLRDRDLLRRLVACTAFSTLALFLVSSLRHKVELNWPALAWAPSLTLLIVSCDWQQASLYRRSIIRGICLAGLMSFVLLLPPALMARISKSIPVARTEGWSILARRLSSLAGPRPMVSTRYQDASIFSFYCPLRPRIPVLRRGESRPSQFDLAPELPFDDNIEFLLITDGPVLQGTMSLVSGDWHYQVHAERCGEISVDVDGLQSRTRFYAFCRILDRDLNTPSR